MVVYRFSNVKKNYPLDHLKPYPYTKQSVCRLADTIIRLTDQFIGVRFGNQLMIDKSMVWKYRPVDRQTGRRIFGVE